MLYKRVGGSLLLLLDTISSGHSHSVIVLFSSWSSLAPPASTAAALSEQNPRPFPWLHSAYRSGVLQMEIILVLILSTPSGRTLSEYLINGLWSCVISCIVLLDMGFGRIHKTTCSYTYYLTLYSPKEEILITVLIRSGAWSLLWDRVLCLGRELSLAVKGSGLLLMLTTSFCGNPLAGLN